jgi:hypothetical protein
MFAPLADLIAYWPIWLAVTLLMGGPAAYASGRALALNWRAFGIGIAYAGVLAAVSSFLAYALFGTSVIPAWAIAGRIAALDALGAAALLAGWAATFLILLAISFIGWHVTRSRQMRRQYPFLYPP